MDFENFKEHFTEDVAQALYERGIEASVTTNTVEKMNETYEAFTVTPEGSNVGVNLNMERFFEAYEDGVPYSEVVQRATDIAEQGVKESPNVDIANLTNYDFMKEKLAMEVVSVETNADMLAKIPHQQIEDMAVIYRCVLSSGEEGMSSVVVTNAMLESFGVTPEQLHADALENAPEIKPAVIKGMTEMMQEMMGEDFASLGLDIIPTEEMMYVATVPDKVHGAGIIAYQDFMDQAAEKLGGDFFVLPSSIHEILLVRDDGQHNYHDLESMVREVNETQVAPEEKLTDNVYHYDSKNHIFELAAKFEERMQEKEAGLEDVAEEKGSVLADLNEKKAECAAKPHAKDAVEKSAKSKGGEAI